MSDKVQLSAYKTATVTALKLKSHDSRNAVK